MNYVQGENKRKYTDKEVAEIICRAWNTHDACLSTIIDIASSVYM